MARLLRDVRIVLQSERLIAQRQFAVLRVQTGLLALAGGAAAVGVVMLNVAGFFALRTALGGGGAALVVALVDFLLAAILVAAAGRQSVERETKAAVEVRDMAIADIERELNGVVKEADLLRSQIQIFARDPGRVLLGGVVEAILALLTRKSD
ncbi:MAG: hypothetical protein KDA73_13395 [Rhodobacteraceae bacterium]|nr:hypothetical protein [Paracoccaceae bacterium]